MCPSGTNNPGGKVLAVMGIGHGRKCQQTHQGHYSTDNAAGRGKYRTGNECGYGHGTWQVAGGELQG